VFATRTERPTWAPWASAALIALGLTLYAAGALGALRADLRGEILRRQGLIPGRRLVWAGRQPNQTLTLQAFDSRTPQADVQVILMLRNAPRSAEDPDAIPTPGHRPPDDFELPVMPQAEHFVSQELGRNYVFVSYTLRNASAADVVGFYRARLSATEWTLKSQQPLNMPRPTAD